MGIQQIPSVAPAVPCCRVGAFVAGGSLQKRSKGLLLIPSLCQMSLDTVLGMMTWYLFNLVCLLVGLLLLLAVEHSLCLLILVP